MLPSLGLLLGGWGGVVGIVIDVKGQLRDGEKGENDPDRYGEVLVGNHYEADDKGDAEDCDNLGVRHWIA